MKIDGKWLIIGFLLGLVAATYAYAQTVDQIWQAIYNSATHTIRVTAV